MCIVRVFFHFEVWVTRKDYVDKHPQVVAGSAFPDARVQQSTALLDGGTAKAIGETAKFLKEQRKVETVLPDYSPYVSAKFVQE